MSFDWAATKNLLRQTVHTTLGVEGFYQDSSMSTPVPIRVRWHSKIDTTGDLESSGYAVVIEGIDQLVFERAEARLKSVKSTGTVTIPSLGGAVLTLGTLNPYNGPYEEIWSVAQE